MMQIIPAKLLKDYEQNLVPYYLKEIVPHAVKLKVFKAEDAGCQGTSTTPSGMGRIREKTSAEKYIIEFLNKATIHGLNHLAAPRRHFVERILTMLFLGVALACLVVSSWYSWYQYQNDATSMIVDFDFEHFNVTKPAITVCLSNKISTDKFPEVFKKFGVEDTEEARNFFLFISNPTYSTLNQTPIYNNAPPEKWLAILRDLYIDAELIKCAMGHACEEFNVTNIDIVTEKGMCTTVYGTYAIYASVDYWFSDSWTVFPQYTLPVYTYAYQDERISLNHIPGPYEESIAFHHPNELPKQDDLWWHYTEMGAVDIKITIQAVDSSKDLRKLSKRQRACNFPEDGGLQMWPVYTRNMCVMECRYNSFKRKCGCYPYFARPIPGISICNATQLRCIGNLSKKVISLMEKEVNYCNCPGNCETATYTGITFVKRNLNSDNWADEVTKWLNSRVVNIDLQFPFYKLRHELFFGFNEFLVAVGGAAGLFLGASIISFIEILYYATLRLFWYKNKIHTEGRE